MKVVENFWEISGVGTKIAGGTDARTRDVQPFGFEAVHLTAKNPKQDRGQIWSDSTVRYACVSYFQSTGSLWIAEVAKDWPTLLGKTRDRRGMDSIRVHDAVDIAPILHHLKKSIPLRGFFFGRHLEGPVAVPRKGIAQLSPRESHAEDSLGTGRVRGVRPGDSYNAAMRVVLERGGQRLRQSRLSSVIWPDDHIDAWTKLELARVREPLVASETERTDMHVKRWCEYFAAKMHTDPISGRRDLHSQVSLATRTVRVSEPLRLAQYPDSR